MTANQITLLAALAFIIAGSLFFILRRIKRQPPPPQEHRPHSGSQGYDPHAVARSIAAGRGADGGDG